MYGLRYVKNEAMNKFFVCSLCWPVENKCLNQEREGREFKSLVCLRASLKMFSELVHRLWFYLPRCPAAQHPTLSCLCRTWHRRPPPLCGKNWLSLSHSSVSAPAQRQSSALFLEENVSMSYEGTEPFGNHLDPFCVCEGGREMCGNVITLFISIGFL